MFHRRYGVDFPESLVDPERHERILVFLHQAGLLGRRDVFVPRPVSIRKLRRVHDDAYLDGLQSPDALVPVLGFRPDDALLDRYLEAHRLATGGTVLATDLAWRDGGVTVNLGGGFHHASADRGAGFCVFNDVAVAVRNWRRHGGEGPVLVLDLDLHDGDGTRAVFRDDPSVFTLSIHNRDLGDVDAVGSESIALGDDVADDRYLRAVRDAVPRVFARVRPRLVFYLAGCDPAEDDRIGNWRISAGGLLERDRFVLDRLRSGTDPVPVVVLLAGGYGSGAWRHSARSLSALLGKGEVVEPPHAGQLTLARFRKLYRRIHADDLSHEPPTDDPWSLTPADLSPALGGMTQRNRFLGFYTRHGIEVALERYGALDHVRERGFRRLYVDLDVDPAAGDTVRLFSRDWPDVPLVELRARRDSTRIPGMDLLSVEWLRLQDPSTPFTDRHPRLPGQEHPGLGMLREVFALLVLMCERLRLEGIVIVAGHYHLVAVSDETLRFLDPRDRARFRAMREALAGEPVARASEIVDRGGLVDGRTGETVRWKPIAMVLPVSDRLRRRLDERDRENGRPDPDDLAPRYRIAPGAGGTGPVA